MFLFFFPTPQGEEYGMFVAAFIYSLIQAACVIYFFHVSFYSSKSRCWDKVGWYIHTLTILICHVFLLGILTFYTVKDIIGSTYGLQSPHNCLRININLIWIVSSARFWTLHAKKMVFDTGVWYKERHKSMNRIVDKTDDQSREIAQPASFMDYQMGEGEGQRNLNKQLTLSEDVYTVLFCGLIKAEYREYVEWKYQMDQKAKQNEDGDRPGSSKRPSSRL